MALEIERKFLVTSDAWRQERGTRTNIVQAYIALDERVQVRVRIQNGENAVLTIKSREPGLVRTEFEYSIPIDDARAMLPLRTGSLIEKTRTAISHGGRRWEVDVFSGDLAGLVLAELELDDAARAVLLPDWIGREVTGNPRYYNAALAVSGAVPVEQDEEVDCEV